ncbi:MAG: 3'(2'),5'-bisphosphate nucleotidase CysQ [Deltaproteobacteria bacterium]|jgi:3'(2'), 5'-bisphosphate nucleotidase|nr:3'(2'),5'-bisphosphate nucleotidase CysQ [Deltaproteobacteria bacterium]MBT6433079.1 3'(2'),5'-bisphosphate nucleotidase CysQ [Deltaproteobacteria bacterium]MBT6492383.1 3'(2'),5'-bisphosphate nucleotidase CysQ [Deltaproteobacteria bacterium]
MTTFGNLSLAPELETAIELARAAGAIIMNHYAQGTEVEIKGDDSPVTVADKDANELIVKGLREAFPDDAILAEESTDDLARQGYRRLWCVDPLDGTREFIDKNGMFVVMIGLAIDGEAKAGVVYQPTEDLLMWGADGMSGVIHNGEDIQHGVTGCSTPQDASMVVSRSHRSSTVTAVAERLGVKNEKPLGSVGLKVAYIVMGKAEMYLSTSDRMMEWDTCAPEAILRASGGTVTDIRGEPLRYNKTKPNTHFGVLATNGLLHRPAVLALVPVCQERQWNITG